MYHIYYTDSLGDTHKLSYSINEYHSVMELIWDGCLEEWGDCKGRAWCGTCHVETSQTTLANELNPEEKLRLNQLSNVTQNSRLSCQITLNEKVHKKRFVFRGDD